MAIFESEGVKFEDAPLFNPSYTPTEMFRMGIFGGGYFQIETELPENFIKEMGALWPQNCKPDKKNNFYKIIGGASLEWWREQGLIHPDDPNGWVEWYIKFYYGRRHPDDNRQIGRFRSFIARHLGMLRSYQSKGRDSEKTKQNLLQWAWDHHVDFVDPRFKM
jgi:hypothetical protein